MTQTRGLKHSLSNTKMATVASQRNPYEHRHVYRRLSRISLNALDWNVPCLDIAVPIFPNARRVKQCVKSKQVGACGPRFTRTFFRTAGVARGLNTFFHVTHLGLSGGERRLGKAHANEDLAMWSWRLASLAASQMFQLPVLQTSARKPRLANPPSWEILTKVQVMGEGQNPGSR
jgi:hypothetical protein